MVAALVRSVRLEDGSEFPFLDPNSGPVPFAQQAEAAAIVVDPLIAASAGNVYKTALEASTERKKLNGPCTVEFRNPTLFTAGVTYDFTDAAGKWNTTFIGSPPDPTHINPAVTLLTFGVGTVIVGVRDWDFILTSIAAVGAGAPLLSPPDGVTIRVRGGSQINGAATAVFVRAVAATASGVDVLVFDDAAINVNCDTTAGSGSFLVIGAIDGGAFAASKMSQGAGTTILVILESDASGISLTQAGIPGGLVFNTNLFVNATTANQKGPGGGFPGVQAFVGTLVAGVTALIPASITATSRIVVSVKSPVPGAGNLTADWAALAADRVVGAAGAGGGFKITALLAAGTINVLDTSTCDAIVIN